MTAGRYLVCHHGSLARSCYTCELETRIRELADALTAARRWRWQGALVRGLALGAGVLLSLAIGLGVERIVYEALR